MALATKLLNIWERMEGLPPPTLALEFLRIAAPNLTQDEVDSLSVGERDSILMKLRCRLFGSVLEIVAPCRHCGESLEADLDLQDFIKEHPEEDPRNLRRIECGGLQLSIRAPTINDIVALTDLDDEAKIVERLLAFCVTDADGNSLTAAELDETMVDEISREMVEADPQADIVLSLSCPCCGGLTSQILDVTSLLARDVSGWAGRTLHAVHQLASAYGWPEDYILSLSPARRQVYLGMVST